MKLKIFFFTCLLNGLCLATKAQIITPYALSSQGTDYRLGGMEFSMTLGQPFISTLSGANRHITQGFEQPISIFPPVAPASQVACSDTNYTFYFYTVVPGIAGSKVEWSKYSNFDSSQFVVSGSFSVTVSPGAAIDTISLRSVDSTDNVVSTAVYTTVWANNGTPTTPFFISGPLLICKGSGGCFEAIAEISDSIRYSISSGTAIIDSVTGCVSNVQSDFIITATSYYACKDSSTDLEVFMAPYASISPTDTTIWRGDSVILNATGGASYSWPSLGAGTSSVRVSPTNDTTVYTVHISEFGCSDSISSKIITTDTLLLFTVSANDTIASGDSAEIMVIPNLPNTAITWSRTNAANVAGDTSGYGGYIQDQLLNKTSALQETDFDITGTNKGRHGYANHPIHSGPEAPMINDTAVPNNTTIYTCDEQFKVITRVTNTVDSGFKIYQVLPTYIHVDSFTYTCDSINTTWSGDTVIWTFEAAITPNCTITTYLKFDCSTPAAQIKIHTITWVGDPSDVLLYVVQPKVLITSTITPSYSAPGGFFIISEPDTITWAICATAGIIDSLNLLFNFPDAIDSSVKTFELYRPDSGWSELITVASGPDSSVIEITSALIDSVYPGKPFLQADSPNACIYIRQIDTLKSCTGMTQSATLTPRFTCAVNSSYPCSVGSAGTSPVNVGDDFSSALPIQLDSFRLYQGVANITDTGINPCDTASCTIRYALHNPIARSFYPYGANYKSLDTFTTYINNCWFNTGGMNIQLLSANGIGTPVTLTDTSYSYINDTLKISFSHIQILDSIKYINDSGTVPVFSTLPPYTGNNEMNNNTAFIISIGGLHFNPHCNDFTNCNAQSGIDILGMSTGSTMSYYTMCGYYAQPAFTGGDYGNNVSTALYGGASPPIVIAGSLPTSTLQLCWEENGSAQNPWLPVDEEGKALFNCTDHGYAIQLGIPADHFTLNLSQPITFKPTNGSTYTLSDTGVTFDTLIGGDSVYNIKSTLITNSGCFSASVNLNIDSCNSLGGYSTFTANLDAVCGCDSILYCIGQNTNVVEWRCSGLCDSTGIGTLPIDLADTIFAIFQRIPISAEATGPNPRLDRAYPCDQIELEVKGVAYATAGYKADSIYLEFSYSDNEGSLFSVQNAYYSIGGGSENGPFTAFTAFTAIPVLRDTQYYIDAYLPGGTCGGDSLADTSVSSMIMNHSDTFFIKLILKVNYNLSPTFYNDGIYDFQLLEPTANIRFIDCNDTIPDHNSCDPLPAQEMTLIAHSYKMRANFISPGENPVVDICKQRLLITTTATGGFPQSQEMPDEIRPLIVWPDSTVAPNTISLSELANLMPLDTSVKPSYQYTPGNFVYDTNILCSTCYYESHDTTAYFNGDSVKGGTSYWPKFGKWGPYFMNLLVEFDKLNCADTPLTAMLHFNYWTQGELSNTCPTPTAYFDSTANRDTAISTLENQGSVVFTSTSDGRYNITPESQKDYKFSGFIEFSSGSASGGVMHPWIYVVSIAPQIDSFYIDTTPMSVGKYFFFGSTIGQGEVTFETSLDSCTFGNFTIKMYTGYSCSPDSIHGPPVANPYGACNIDSGYIVLQVNPPAFNNGISPQNTTINGCEEESLTYTIQDAVFAPIYSPSCFINIPPNIILDTIKIGSCQGGSTGGTRTITFGVDAGAGTFDCSNDIQNALRQLGDTAYLNGVDTGYIPVRCDLTITAYIRAASDTSSSYENIIFIATGTDKCGAPLDTTGKDSASCGINLIPVNNIFAESITSTYGLPCKADTLKVVPNYGSGVTYHWSTGATTNSIPVAAGGAYSVTLTNTQCSVTLALPDTVIPVNIDTASITTTGGGNLPCTVLILTATYYPSFSYRWSTGITTDSIEVTEPGTYSVTVINFECADTVVLTDSVGPNSICCQGGTSGTMDLSFNNISSSQLVSYLGLADHPGGFDTLRTADMVSFSGTFTIDSNFVFYDCPKILFGPGASINVRPGVELRVLNSNLDDNPDCGYYLWQGIQDSGMLDVENSVISDAQYGIQVYTSAGIGVKNSAFVNNFIGIYFAGHVTFHSVGGDLYSVVIPSFPFTGNHFFGTRDLLPNYPGMENNGFVMPVAAAMNQHWPWAGIDFEDITAFNISEQDTNMHFQLNTFNALNNGILSYNTTLSIGGSTFENISTHGDVFTFDSILYEGNGILANTTIIQPLGRSLAQCGLGGHGQVSFQNVNSAIVVNGQTTSIFGNNISTGVPYGIKIMNGKGGNTLISANCISTTRSGVSLVLNDPVSSETVSGNNFQISGASDTALAYGIEIHEQGNPPTHYGQEYISNNNTIVAGTNTMAGIYAVTTKGLTVNNNFIQMSGSENADYGILFNNCDSLTDYYNDIYGHWPLSGNYQPVGIDYESTHGISAATKNYHLCNAMNNLSVGMQFFGTDQYSYIGGNKFDYSLISSAATGSLNNGLLVEDSGIIDMQIHSGNQWYSPTGTPSTDYPDSAAKNDNDSSLLNRHLIEQEKFYYTNSAPYFPPTVAPATGWFFNTPDTDYQCSLPLMSHVLFHDSLTPMDSAIINDSLQFDTEFVWQNEKLLYQKIMADTALQNSSSLAHSFYLSKAGTAMASIANIETAMQNAMQPDSVPWLQLTGYRDSIGSSLAKFAALDSMRLALFDSVSYTTDSIEFAQIKGWMSPGLFFDPLLHTDSALLNILIAYADTSTIDTATLNSLNSQMDSVSNYIAVEQESADSMIAIIDSERHARIAVVVDSNIAISTGLDIEQYYQQATAIYLSTIALDSTAFNSTQLNTLYNLAFMCPLKGGEAVFRARAMLALLIDTVYFDESICSGHGDTRMLNISKDSVSNLKVTLHPNPTIDYAILEMNQDIAPLQLQITNDMGQIVMLNSISTIAGTYVINTSSLNSGIFTVCLFNNGNKIFCDRLAIIK